MFLLRLSYGAACFCICTAWLIPNHFLPWTDFYSDFFAFLSLLFLLVASSWEPKKISFLCVFWCFSVLVVLGQFSFGKYYYLSDFLMILSYLLASFLSYQIGLSTVRKKEFVLGLAQVVVVGAVVTALIGIAQFANYSSFWLMNVRLGRSEGNLGQANNYASLLVLGWVALIYLYRSHRLSTLLYCVLLSVLFLGVVAAESRTTVLQVVVILAALIWFAKKKSLHRDLFVFVPIAGFFALYFSFPFINAVIDIDELGASRLVGAPYANRFDLWVLSVHALCSGGWFGHGWGQSVIANFSVLDQFEGSIVYVKYSHNIVIDLLVWNGPIIGGILVVFLAGWFVRRFFDVNNIESLYLFLSVCVLVVHSLLEYPLAYAYFLFPFALMLGLLDNGYSRTLLLSVNTYLYGLVISALFALSLYWITREYLIIEADNRLMRSQNLKLQVDMNTRLSKDVVLLDQEREFIRFARIPARAGLMPDELERMRKVVYRKPIEVAIFRYSLALKLNGFDEEALVELKKIKNYYGENSYLSYKQLFDQEYLARSEGS